MPALTRRLLPALAGIVWSGTAVAAPSNPCLKASSDAQDLRTAQRLREARTALLVCSASTCNPIVRANCEKWLTEVDEEQPTIVIQPIDASGRAVKNVRATVDDRAIELDDKFIAVDPGWHVLRAAGPDGEIAESKVLVARGEKGKTFEIRLASARPAPPPRTAEERPLAPPEPEPQRSMTAPLILGGIGVVALGIFGYFEIVGHQHYSELEHGCFVTKTCTNADEDPVKAEFVGAGVSVAIAAVAITAAVIVYYASDPVASTPAAVSRARSFARGITF